MKSDCDELGAYVHKRNIVCTRNLLEALKANHGAANDDIPQEIEKPADEPLLDPISISLFPINKVEFIKRLVCRHFEVSKQSIESGSRKSVAVLPRHVAMYLARKHTTLSYPEIARRFGGKDHSTAINAFQRIESLIVRDAAMAAIVSNLEASIS